MISLFFFFFRIKINSYNEKEDMSMLSLVFTLIVTTYIGMNIAEEES